MPAYADDTYLLVPSDNESSIDDEFSSIIAWASESNIPLNRDKCVEIIFHKPRTKCQPYPITVLGKLIPRVSQIKILGVTVTNTLSVTPHVDLIVSDCRSRLYALSVLKRHGIDPIHLDRLFNALIVSRLIYASPSWSGFLKESDWLALQAILNKGCKWALCARAKDIRLILELADSRLFKNILSDHKHCLHYLLPPVKILTYSLRPRPHNRCIPLATTRLTNCAFFQRMLTKNTY